MDFTDETTAWHEAGHAMMAVLCGGTIERVTIEPPDDDGPVRYGDTVTRWSGMSPRQLAEAEVRVSLAGPVAEMIFCGKRMELDGVKEWSGDWATAMNAARALSKNDSSARKLLNVVSEEIYRTFDCANAWAAVSAIADELLAHETLEHDSVRDTVGFWQRRQG